MQFVVAWCPGKGHTEMLIEESITSNQLLPEAKQDCGSSAAHPDTAGNLLNQGCAGRPQFSITTAVANNHH